MKKFVLALGILSTLGFLGAFQPGCGGPDNVASCKDVYATINGLKCIGMAKIDDSACDAYEKTTCDVSEYFDCVSSHYKCKDDTTIDTDELAKASECKVPTCN